MTIHLPIRALLFGALALMAASLPSRAQDAQTQASGVVQSLVSDAHAALATGRNADALRQAVSKAFAFDVWERFLIEGREGAFSPEQRAQFRAMLPGFLSHLYDQQFGKGLDRAPVLGGARKVRRDVLVSSTFPRSNGGNLPVDWRVRQTGGNSRVIDVMVGGTSFLLLKKEEFGAIIDQRGAKALLEHMRQNTL